MSNATTENPTATNPTTESPTVTAEMTSQFMDLRPRLVGIAQRVTGSRAEAEDVVQDAWLRWQFCDRDAVRNTTAFLVTMTTRLALNAATCARVRREAPIERWSGDPVDLRDDPSTGPERLEALDAGVDALLAQLAPVERAAFVLRHSFEYPYSRIAELLRVSEVNARQLVSRAGRRLASDRRRPVDEAARILLVRAFLAAARQGEVAALEAVLVADTTRT